MSVANALSMMISFGSLIVSLLSLVVAIVILALKRK
ncbi:putative holin-like toxin [Alicyclobacillus dauci]|uniref:Holin-like toxin n=1 Tax=Alicyclobacillus dauci TaxID=1475485 RepID=A0ABY6Z4P1_9BACL|nr:putative holin-like toxin [Alicyclobacillus dauci]WAH37834.1 putative holin-like toxin [Alicyclobacillus dauci]